MVKFTDKATATLPSDLDQLYVYIVQCTVKSNLIFYLLTYFLYIKNK